MSFKTSVPIRLYSTYSDFINAPQGFDTPASQLDKTKWKHYNQNYFISLVIERFGGNRVTLTILSRENVILDILSTIVGNTNNHFKLSCRSPSLSCKYLKQENGSQVLRRFQIEFINNSDFSNTLIILKSLSIPIKEFPPVPTPSLLIRNYSATNPSSNYSVPSARNHTIIENTYKGSDSFIEQESQFPSTQTEPSILSQQSFLPYTNIGVFQNITNEAGSLAFGNVNPSQENPGNNILNKYVTTNADKNNTETFKIITTSNDLQRTNFITPLSNETPQENQNDIMNKNDLPPRESYSSQSLLTSTNENKEIPAITLQKNNYIPKDDVSTANPDYIHSQSRPSCLTENVEHKKFTQKGALQPLPLVSDNRTIDQTTKIPEPKKNTEISATNSKEIVKDTDKSSDKRDDNKSFDTINSIAMLPKTKVKISKKMIRDKLSDQKFMKWVCNFFKIHLSSVLLYLIYLMRSYHYISLLSFNVTY